MSRHEQVAMTQGSEPLLNSAVKAARAAGAIIKNRFGGDFEVRYKNFKDPVTEVDRACEEQIRSILLKDHPHIAFWGEETGRSDEEATETWIVDPLDGTKNFVHGYPFVAVAIALVRNSEPVVGVVYDPVRDELFSAVKGEGAYLNGQPINVSDTTTLAECLVVTTLSDWPTEQGTLILKACKSCQGVRRGGASALDLCQVAAGRLDAVWEWYLKPWDLAASSLIIQEAQGTVTQPDGRPFDIHQGRVLATNTNLHRAFVEFLQ